MDVRPGRDAPAGEVQQPNPGGAMPPAQHRKVAMTQPNPGPATAAPDPNPTPQAPATGPAAPTTTTTPPAPPGFQPATGQPDTAAAGEQTPAAAADDPAGQLGDAGKKALDAEREARKAAVKAQQEQAKQLAELEKQLKALQPAAELFAQFRKAAVPEAEQTDMERLQKELADVRDETKAERLARWRLEVATDKGLTREQAAELHGTTLEELTAHADRLLKLFPPAPATPPPVPTTEPPNGQQAAPNGQPAPAAGPKPDPSQGARGPVDINAQIQDALAKGDIRTSIALRRQLAAQQTK
jgi:hypothetical protein